MNGKRATMQDIADRTGLSKATVSFAFSAPYKIKKDTYDRVMEAARELDYVPNPTARNFSLGRHNVIGFLLPQKLSVTLSNPHISLIIKGIGTVCEENGYSLDIIPPLHSSLPDAVKGAMVDGIITMGIPIDLGIQDVLRQRHMPIVTIDGGNADSITSVNVDNRAAGRLQIEAALRLGHRKFVIVSLKHYEYHSGGLQPSNSTIMDKFLGYGDALAEYGLSVEDVPVLTCDTSFASGVECADRILENGYGATCILVLADIVALGILQRLRQRGVRVPEDISIIGYDGTEAEMGIKPSLTTIGHSAEKKGALAASFLFEQIGGKVDGNKTCNLDFFFCEGNTLGPVR